MTTRLASYDKALAFKPDSADPLVRPRHHVFMISRRFEDALASLRQGAGDQARI